MIEALSKSGIGICRNNRRPTPAAGSGGSGTWLKCELGVKVGSGEGDGEAGKADFKEPDQLAVTAESSLNIAVPRNGG